MTAPEPAPPDAAVVAAATPAVTAIALPALGEIHLITRESKRIRTTFGSLRIELTPDGATVSRDWFAAPIVAATQTSRGDWVFAAADGLAARSETFTGKLTVIGTAPREVGRRFATTCERVAFAAGEALFTTDGGALVQSAVPGHVIAAAFASAERGMIVVEGGELSETRDGARTWQRVDLGDDAAAGVRCEAGKLRVDTFAASMLIAADGSRDTKTPDPTKPLEADLRQAVRRAALRDFPDLATAFGGVAVADGVRFLQGGRMTTALPAERGRYDREKCELLPWGDGAGVLCEQTLYRDGAHVADSVRNPSLSPDGSAIWDCTAPKQPRKACVRRADGRVNEWPGDASLAHVHGDRIVRGHWGPIDILDAATGVKRDSIAITLPAENITFDHFQLSFDGSIAYANGNAKAGAYVVIVPLAGGKSTTVVLPAGARRAGFIDARRGVAAGRDLARLWRTDDAGATWQPLATAADGAIEAPPAASLFCARQHCVIDQRVVVDFAGARRSAGHVVGSQEPVGGAAAPAALPRLVCSDGSARTAALAGRTVELQARGAEASLSVTGHAWSIAWIGRDRFGAYRARATGTLPIVAKAEYRLFHATRQGLIFERHGPDRLDHVWVPAGGRPVVIPEPSMRGFVRDALVLPDGRAILVREILADHDELTFDWAFLLDRTGKLVARRAMWWPDDEHATNIAGVLDGVPGVARVADDPTQPIRFVPITKGPGTVRPGLAPTTLPACSGPPTPAAAIVPTSGVVDNKTRMLTEIVRAYVRGGRAPCIEALELAEGNRRYSHDPFFVAAHAGGLAGERLEASNATPVSCVTAM